MLAIAVLAVTAGCSAVYDEPAEVTKRGETFSMTITIVTGNTPVSRAADHADDTEETGTADENYIDFDAGDMMLYLFDSTGRYLYTLDTNELWGYSSGSGGNMAYILQTEIVFPSSVTDDDIAAIKRDGLQVMVLANWRGVTGNNNRYAWFGGEKPTLSQVWSNATDLNFDYTVADNGTTWRPSIQEKRLMPFFGVAQNVKFAYSNGTGYNEAFSTIPMQRAVAKIEVIDNLPQENVDVTDVVLTAFNDKGRLIPDVTANPGWAEIGSQVGSSSIPAGVSQRTGLKFFHEPGSKKWIAYVPEMYLGEDVVSEEGTLPDSRTHIDVTVTANLDNYKGAVYPVHFARYNINSIPTLPDNSWKHILRNHIYRFSINNIGIDAELEVHVKPWYLDDDETWDYTDHVTVGEMLEWRAGTYESLDDETGRLLLWIDDRQTLEGWFRIKTPLNGRWFARLTPLDDANPNAITFVDENNDPLEPSYGTPPVCLEASGIIEEVSPAWIRIRPTNFGNDVMSAFKLEFFVENLGVWMRVPMVDKEGVTWNEYTIVRKSNLFI